MHDAMKAYHESWERELDRQFLKNDRYRKRAYICSPLSGSTAEEELSNIWCARAYMLYARTMLGYLARAPHAYLPMLLCDHVAAERALALQFGLQLLEQSEVLLICGDRISRGMKGEIHHAAQLGIPIIVYCEDLYLDVRKLATRAGADKKLVAMDETHPALASNEQTGPGRCDALRRFYQPVDLRSRQKMTQYLTTHFRYPTLNSWNRSTSYACNLKITHLGLSPEVVDKLFDMIQTQGFFDAMDECKWEFAAKHNYLWQAEMNGRSGGYLVLYQGEKRPSGYKSYCTNCGQRNYQLAADGNCTCGVCGRPTRVNFSQTHMQVATYPGRGTDDGEDFEDWSMHALRERVKLVQELDQLADRMVELALRLTREAQVIEEEYFLPQTRKVLVTTL